MKRLYAIAAGASFLAGAALAQDDHAATFERMPAQVRVMSLQGSIMGKTVKGAPYSGMEVSESTQVLADGTRIHNESQTQVFRDSEGRIRRETPNEITIWDPVANASWLLNPKTQTARKLPMGNFAYATTRVLNGQGATIRLRSPADPEEMKLMEGKMKAEIETVIRTNGASTANAVESGVFASLPGEEVRRRTILRQEAAMKATTEPLGKRMIEGVNAEGTRSVTTTAAGAIGNDRPIQHITERWFSPDLQTAMLTRSTDPRTGEESFKLINVNRSEPAAYLFQVPAGYQVIDQK